MVPSRRLHRGGRHEGRGGALLYTLQAAPWLVLPTMVGRTSRAKEGGLGTSPGGSGEADIGKVMCWLSPQTQPLS